MTSARLEMAVKRTAFVLACVASTACTERMLDFTTISSKNVNMPIPAAAKSHRVQGEDKVFALLGVPFGSPSLKAAVDRAIESAGGGYDALIDGVVYRENGLFSQGFKVEGTAVKTTSLRAALGTQPLLFHSSVGISNDKAIESLGIRSVTTADGLDEAAGANGR